MSAFSILTHHIRLVGSCALLGLAAQAAAQSPAATGSEPAVPLTLEDAVRMALENNLTILSEQYNRLTSREAAIVAGANFDPTLSLTTRRNFSESVNSSSDLEGAQSPKNQGFNNSLSVSQRVSTGATATVSTNLNRSSSNSQRSTFNPEFNSGVSFNVRQPLLNGAGVTVNRAALLRAKYGIDRSELSFRARAMDIVRDTEIAFYDLVSARQQLDIRQSALTAAERLVQENEARQRAGLQTELDVMQARVGVANRRSSLVSAQQAVRNANDALLVLLGHREFGGVLAPQGVTFAPVPPVNFEQAYALALENDPDIQSAYIQLQQLELEVKVASNSRLPRLDLNGALGYTGRQDTVPGALDLLRDRGSYNWQLDLQLSVPWGFRAERSRVRSARYNLQQQELRISQLEQGLLVNVRRAVRSVETDRESVDIATLQSELSAREFQLEKARFDSGLSTARLVVDAQQRQDEARVNESQSRISLRQNTARLRRIEGNTLDHFDLTLPAAEPPPAQ